MEKSEFFDEYCRRRLVTRRILIKAVALGMITPLSACSQGANMKKEIVLNVEAYSYLNRPIHNIIFNGTDLGVMNSFGDTGTITSVSIPFGVQAFKWTLGGPRGMAGNGMIIEAKNKLTIAPEQIPQGARYIGLHIYPDYTAEVTFSDGIPDRTERGEKIISESE